MRAATAGMDLAKNIAVVLAALVALIILSGTKNSKEQSAKNADEPVQSLAQPIICTDLECVHEGVVKRFSDRNGWGLIVCSIPCKAFANGFRETRRDVRLYRKEKVACSLIVGDTVQFRAVADDDAPGWFKAVDVQRKEAVPSQSRPETETDAFESISKDGCAPSSDPPQDISEEMGLCEQAGVATLIDRQAAGARPVSSQLPHSYDSLSPGHIPSDRKFLWNSCSEPVKGAECKRKEEVVDAEAHADEEKVRPATTPVVARRLVHTHLAVPLSPEKKSEERAFWMRSSRTPSSDGTASSASPVIRSHP